MEIFKLFGSIFINTDAADESLHKVENAAEKLGNGIVSMGDKMASAGNKLTLGVTTPILALGTKAVKTAADFEASMSEVSAISGATGGDLKKLESLAKKMGETTKFSASESAEALKYMAMAGWKTEDMLNGLEGIMNLSAASGEDLAATSDIVTDALTAFGLSAADSGHFSDILAATSSNANTNVGLLGETFKYVAPLAGSLGYSAEDAATAIGLMANAGIKGSQAGTALRSIMTRLAKPTKESQTAMDALGLSITDSSGKMKPLSVMVEDMRKGFAGLTEDEKATYAAMLGGQEAMSGLLAIVNASEADFQKLSGAINGCNGSAAEMAATMNDNLNGQIVLLKSQLEAIFIQFAELIMPYLKEGLEWLSKVLTYISNLDEGTKGMIIRIGLLAAAIGPVLSILGKGVSVVGTVITVGSKLFGGIGSIIKVGGLLSGGITKVIGLIGGIIKAVGAAIPAIAGIAPPVLAVIAVIGALVLAGVALCKNWDKVSAFAKECWEGIKNFFGGIGEAICGIFQGIGEFIGNIFHGIGEAANFLMNGWNQVITFGKECFGGFKDFLGGIGSAIGGIFHGVGESAGKMRDDVVSGVNEMKEGAAQKVTEMGEKIATGFQNIKEGAAEKIRDLKENWGGKFTEAREKIVSEVEQMKENTAQKVTEMGEKITTGFQNMKEGAAEKIQDLKEKWGGKFTEAKDKIVSEVEQMKENAAQKVTEMGEKITTGFQNMKEGAAEKIQDLKEKWGSKFTEAKDKIVSETTELGAKVSDHITQLRDNMVGKISDLAEKGVQGFANLKERGADAVNSLRDVVGGCFENMGSFVFSTFESFGSRISSMFSGVSDAVKGIVDKIKDFMSFDWKLPKIKLPHFSVAWDSSGMLGTLATKIGLPGLPKLDVEWYKNGGIMMEPTAFGRNPSSGRMMAGGEAGPEAIAPIELLKSYISEAIEERDGQLYSVLASMLELMREYLPKYGNMQMVLDTGKLVGSIAQPINEELGWIKHKRERGN